MLHVNGHSTFTYSDRFYISTLFLSSFEMLYQWYLWFLSFWYLCSRSPLTFSQTSFPLTLHLLNFTSILKMPFPSLFLIMLQDWSIRASTSCGRFDPSGGIWQSTLHTLSSGLSYSPDSTIATARCPVFRTHCSVDRTVLCVWPPSSYFNSSPCQAFDEWSTSLVERCIEDPVQTSCFWHFNVENDVTPSYLASCCIPVASVIGRSCLRSAASSDFLVPACSTRTLGPREFAVSCPASWNSLPPYIRVPGISLATFKKKLKSYLFTDVH